MSIVCCTIFYNDSPERLERAFKSIKGKVDSILAIDGKYREFPTINGNKPWSTDGCIDIARKYADTVIETNVPWYDQVTKRNAYLQLNSGNDFYFILDADEVFSGHIPQELRGNVYDIEIVTHKCNSNPLHGRGARLIRHHPGICYAARHAFLWVDNFIINRQEYALNDIDSLTTCKIDHYPDERPKEWLRADGEYIRHRDENTVMLPDMPQEVNRTLYDQVRMKFLGRKYSGYDALLKEFIEVKEGQFAFVSVEKSKQLIKDYPHEWKPMGVLKKQDNRPYKPVRTTPLGAV